MSISLSAMTLLVAWAAQLAWIAWQLLYHFHSFSGLSRTCKD